MVYLLSIIMLVVLDQLIKYWAVNSLQSSGPIEIWKNVFHFSYVENRGAAFGIMQNKQFIFIIITIAVLIAIAYYWRKIPNNRFMQIYKWCLVLIVGGAIGNLIDRVFLGFVVDMFYFVLIDFPVFNLADICVVVGTIIFSGVMLLEDFKTSKKDALVGE